jgi:hypothetical protein
MKMQTYIRRLAFLAAIFLSIVPASADPIELPEKPITPEITILISLAIFLEVVCILLVLRRSQKPRFFILWLIGIHLFTYPAFLGFLWLEQNMRPAFAAGIGEGLVVPVEGILIYLICRFIPSAKSNLASPSIIKCLLASLIGNIISAAAFPVLTAIHDRFPSI